MIRRLLPLVLLPMLAGCSSPYKIELVNETETSISATVIWHDTYRGKTTRRTADYSLAAGDRETEGAWFGEPPTTFTVRVQSGERKWERVFRSSDYPRSLRGRTSMGPTTQMIVRNGDISFADSD